MATKMIQSWQRSRVFGLARELGLTTKSNDKSDDLHQLLDSRTGKASLTHLTYEEANSLIVELGHRQRFGSVPVSSALKFQFREVPGGISEGQYRKIIALMYELRKLDPLSGRATIEQRVAGIIRTYLHLSASNRDPYAWLSFQDGNRLIEAIKGILKSAKKKFDSGCEVK